MALHTENNLIACIGRSGSGKTSTMLCILWETIDYFDGITVIFNGGPVAYQFDALEHRLKYSALPLQNPNLTRKGCHTKSANFVGILSKYDVDVILYDGDSLEDFLDGVADLSAHYKVFVVIDELCKMTSLHKIPMSLLSIADTGRHAMLKSNGEKVQGKGVSLLVGFRRTQAIHKGLFNQIKQVYLHKIVSKKDYKQVLDVLSEDCTLEEISELGQGDFFLYDDGNKVEKTYYQRLSENMAHHVRQKEEIEEIEENEETEETE